VTSERFRPKQRWLKRAAGISNAYGLALLLTLITFLVSSMLPHGDASRMVSVVLVGVTSLVGLASSGISHNRLRLVTNIAILAVALGVAGLALDVGGLMDAAIIISAALLFVTAARILGRVLSAATVTFRTILGALTTYTMLGLLFGFVYVVLEEVQGGAFFEGAPPETNGQFMFFSYTTLTTTGYGNLVPAGQPGESIAVIEMLTGQIFLVTLVAGLVSLWRPGRRFELGDDDESAK
jgi:hypothetical protein